MTSPVENSAMAGASGARSFNDRPFRNLGMSLMPLNFDAAISFWRIFLLKRMGTSDLAAAHTRARYSAMRGRDTVAAWCNTEENVCVHRLCAASQDHVRVSCQNHGGAVGDGLVRADACLCDGVRGDGVRHASRQCTLTRNVAGTHCGRGHNSTTERGARANNAAATTLPARFRGQAVLYAWPTPRQRHNRVMYLLG